MNKVFAFEWCGCIFESGFSVVSLHTTKRTAFKAMVAFVNTEWLDMRAVLGRGFDPLAHSAWRVRTLEVLP